MTAGARTRTIGLRLRGCWPSIPWVAAHDGPTLDEVCDRFGVSRGRAAGGPRTPRVPWACRRTRPTRSSRSRRGRAGVDALRRRLRPPAAPHARAGPRPGGRRRGLQAVPGPMPRAPGHGAWPSWRGCSASTPPTPCRSTLGDARPGLLDAAATAVAERRQVRDRLLLLRPRRAQHAGRRPLRRLRRRRGVVRAGCCHLAEARASVPGRPHRRRRPARRDRFDPAGRRGRRAVVSAPRRRPTGHARARAQARWVVETYPVDEVDDAERRVAAGAPGGERRARGSNGCCSASAPVPAWWRPTTRRSRQPGACGPRSWPATAATDTTPPLWSPHGGAAVAIPGGNAVRRPRHARPVRSPRRRPAARQLREPWTGRGCRRSGHPAPAASTTEAPRGPDDEAGERTTRRAPGPASAAPSSSGWLVIGGVLVALRHRRSSSRRSASRRSRWSRPSTSGDRVLVNKLSYKLHDVHRGDIIVFERPARRAGRRRASRTSSSGSSACRARPSRRATARSTSTASGSTSPTCRTGTPTDRASPPTATIPDDHVFVMGDNRDDSTRQPRASAPIDEDAIVGRAFVRVWPLTELGGSDRAAAASRRGGLSRSVGYAPATASTMRSTWSLKTRVDAHVEQAVEDPRRCWASQPKAQHAEAVEERDQAAGPVGVVQVDRVDAGLGAGVAARRSGPPRCARSRVESTRRTSAVSARHASSDRRRRRGTATGGRAASPPAARAPSSTRRRPPPGPSRRARARSRSPQRGVELGERRDVGGQVGPGRPSAMRRRRGRRRRPRRRGRARPRRRR